MILEGVLIDVNLSPLDGVIDIWESGSIRSWVLDGLGGSVIGPFSVLIREVSTGNVPVVRSPVAKSEHTSLDAKLPFVSKVLNQSLKPIGILNIVEFLMLVLLNKLIKIAWDSWEVVESCSADSVFIFTGNYQWLVVRGSFSVEVHASTWLHGGSGWLSVFCGLSHIGLWGSVAFNDLKIKLHV